MRSDLRRLLFFKNYLEGARAGRIREDADDQHSKDEDEGEKNLGKSPEKKGLIENFRQKRTST